MFAEMDQQNKTNNKNSKALSISGDILPLTKHDRYRYLRFSTLFFYSNRIYIYIYIDDAAAAYGVSRTSGCKITEACVATSGRLSARRMSCRVRVLLGWSCDDAAAASMPVLQSITSLLLSDTKKRMNKVEGGGWRVWPTHSWTLLCNKKWIDAPSIVYTRSAGK